MNGVEMSMTTFYNRLRVLVETGIIEKLSHGYNKNEYVIKQ
jgi:Fe2+ or Zn2+ uptake regulation protein